MQPLPPLQVLLVEDDLVFQDGLRQVFAQVPGDWEIHAVQKGADALQVLADLQTNLALALVDIGLPDMSGIDVIAAVRSQFADVPILVATSFQTEATFLDAVRAGATGYLLKGETVLSLSQSIRLVLAGQYPVSPALARYLFKLAKVPSLSPSLPHTPSTSATGASAQAPDLSQISEREWEVLQHIAQGHSYARCAELMHVSLSTVQSHIKNTYRKLGVNNHRQAMNKISPPSGGLR